MLAEAKSEILKQECKVDTLNTCIGEFQRQAHSHRLELDSINCVGMKNLEETRPDFSNTWRSEKNHFETLVSEISMNWKN